MQELNNFLKEYEIATNSHEFENVKPLIHKDAVYIFSEGRFDGIEEIQGAFERTWNRIKDETYSINGVKWTQVSEYVAECTYNFHWKGTLDGKLKEGQGQGTNTLFKVGNNWKIIHEHLSS